MEFLDNCQKSISWERWVSQIPSEWPDEFVERLKKFLSRYGYILQGDEKLTLRILMWAWSHAHVATSHTSYKYIIRHKEPINPDDETWNWYCHTISNEDWDTFMDAHSIQEWCDDFTDTGICQRQDLARFVWTLLDLEASPANKHIIELFISDTNEDTTDIQDPSRTTAYTGNRRTY